MLITNLHFPSVEQKLNSHELQWDPVDCASSHKSLWLKELISVVQGMTFMSLYICMRETWTIAPTLVLLPPFLRLLMVIWSCSLALILLWGSHILLNVLHISGAVFLQEVLLMCLYLVPEDTHLWCVSATWVWNCVTKSGNHNFLYSW